MCSKKDFCLIFKISVYYTVSFGSNKNNDYFRQGFPLSISVKISVTFLWNFRVSEALFISVRFPTVRIPLRSISAEHGILEISELRIALVFIMFKKSFHIAFHIVFEEVSIQFSNSTVIPSLDILSLAFAKKT